MTGVMISLVKKHLFLLNIEGRQRHSSSFHPLKHTSNHLMGGSMCFCVRGGMQSCANKGTHKEVSSERMLAEQELSARLKHG